MTASSGLRAQLNARLVDDVATLHNERARDRIAELELALLAAHTTVHELTQAAKTHANYKASLAAGYIDLSFLEAS
jgi:hypothetical protein